MTDYGKVAVNSSLDNTDCKSPMFLLLYYLENSEQKEHTQFFLKKGDEEEQFSIKHSSENIILPHILLNY